MKPTDPKNLRLEDRTAAALYHCIALRHLSSYAAARGTAEEAGADLSEHGAMPSQATIEARYTALAEEWLVEPYKTAVTALAALNLAAAIVTAQRIDHTFRAPGDGSPVSEELEQQHLYWALTGVADWVNVLAAREVFGIGAQEEGRATMVPPSERLSRSGI